MAVAAAKIATNTTGDPEVAHEVTIRSQKDKSITRRRRALIGWNHHDDSPDGLKRGKVWCWVTAHNHLQIFDATCNRSTRPGQVVFCGVANFTMVRMFHPFWCPFGRIPRDMVPSDKARCRYNYRLLMRRWRAQQGLPQDDEESDDPDPPNDANSSGRGRGRGRKPGGRGRGHGRPRGGRGGRGGRRAQRRVAEEEVTGEEVNVPGSTASDSMDISEDDCSRGCDSTDSDSDENETNDHARAKPRPRRAVSEATTTDTDISEDTPDGTNIKQEKEDLVKIEDEAEEEADREEQETQEQAVEDYDLEMIDFVDLTTSDFEEDEDGNPGDDAAAAATADTDDDKDDDAIFFPSADVENSREAGDDLAMAEGDKQVEEIQGAVAVDPAVKEEELRQFDERERVLVASVRGMQGPREVIVIDDD